MRKLTSFNFVTLNGFYKDAVEGISWHKHGGEEAEFSAQSLKPGNTLLFGRRTYEMMEKFWTSESAFQSLPVVAKGMKKSEKLVFSNRLKKVEWENTRILSGDLVKEITKLKKLKGKDITILGSGELIGGLTDAGLIDAYQIMIDPVALGKGTPLFKNVKHELDLKLMDTRIFKSGTVLLTYALR